MGQCGVLLQELVPRSDVERAYAQACCWDPLRAWSRATRDLYRDRTGIASAEYLAMAKRSVESGDYQTALTTIQAVEQYSTWLTPTEKISLVRVLCDILALILEKSDPQAAELQTVAVKTAVHFISGFSSERNAVLSCLTDLRNTGAVDLLSERAVLTHTRQLRAGFEQGKHFCDKIINDIDKRPRFIKSLGHCTRKLVDQINKKPDNCYHLIVLGMLSEYLLCLEILCDRIDDATIAKCKVKIQTCVLAVSKKLGTINENRNYCGQILHANLLDFDTVFKLGIMDPASHRKITLEHEGLDIVADLAALRKASQDDVSRDTCSLRRHLVTLLSLCALSDQNSAAMDILITCCELIARARVPDAAALQRFCRDQQAVFGRAQWQMKKNPEIHLANLILLAGANLQHNQEDLALLLLNQVLDSFQNTKIDLLFIEALWQYSTAHLPQYWSLVYPKFVVPLAGLTELHLGGQAVLDAVYRHSLLQIKRSVGAEAEHALLQQLICARENFHGEKRKSLIPLLRLMAANADDLSYNAQCLEACRRILAIMEKQIESGVEIELELFENLLFCTKYQMRLGCDSLEDTNHLIEKSLDICLQKQAVTAGLIFLLCQFTVFALQFGENVESGPSESASVPPASTSESTGVALGANFFLSLIEKIGEDSLIEALTQDQQLPEPQVQEQSLIMLFKISQRNSWQLHYKLIPLLIRHASHCIFESEFDRAVALYELVRSIEDCKSFQLVHAFLLAKNSKLDEAIQLLEQVLEEPVPILDAEQISRLSFLLKECIRTDRKSTAAKIVAILLPVGILNDAQALTVRVGSLIYGLVSQGDLETAEHLLTNAKQQCEGCEYITPELIVPYLCAPIRYARFVESLWQPKAEQEGTYPQLFELKRQVIARHRARYLNPDT